MPSSVSKSLPTVVKVTVPHTGEVQVNQTDAPPTSPWSGSPTSRVAWTFVAPTEPLSPESAVGADKESSAGPAASAATRFGSGPISPESAPEPNFCALPVAISRDRSDCGVRSVPWAVSYAPETTAAAPATIGDALDVPENSCVYQWFGPPLWRSP